MIHYKHTKRKITFLTPVATIILMMMYAPHIGATYWSEITGSDQQSCNCVAFRLDDIQDYSLNEAQIQIMKKFEEKDLPLTIGIIGSTFGNDKKVVNYAKQSLKDQRIEVANHGWEHEDFSKLSKEEQSELINKTNTKISQILGVTPRVLIPPFNQFNEMTNTAAMENGITHVSSVLAKGSQNPLEDKTIFQFPEGSSTGVISKSGLFVGINHSLTFSYLKESLENYGFAVVTLHPQEFSLIKPGNDGYENKVDKEQLLELDSLLELVQKNDLTITTIGMIDTLSKDDSSQTNFVPNWVKNNAKWWSEGIIDDSSFTNGIEFLIKNEIIKISNQKISETPQESDIPEWVKNNARWWSEGLVTENEFLNGIRYLIQQGIIIV